MQEYQNLSFCDIIRLNTETRFSLMAKSKKISITLADLVAKGLTTSNASKIFKTTILPSIKSEVYQKNISVIFNFALTNDVSLFTKNTVTNVSELDAMCEEYLQNWVNKYVNDRDNPALKRPLKNFGEKDSALITRIAANTGADEKTLSTYLTGHFIYMSAENMNGMILEEFLAEVLEPHGWKWCAGSVLRAVDFCYISKDEIILLQIKNKYNTENSSSSAIRNGTEIRKWNRLRRPSAKVDRFAPIPNWDALIKLINADKDLAKQLTEEKYLKYIMLNSTKEIEKIDK